jgi:chemotaxis protein histidine kinase CheA
MDLINESIVNTFDTEVKRRLLSLSIDLINEKLIKINMALQAHDPRVLFHSLHTLKGLSSIGIEKIPILCQTMIDLIDKDSDEELIVNFELLKKYSVDYIDYIKTYILY